MATKRNNAAKRVGHHHVDNSKNSQRVAPETNQDDEAYRKKLFLDQQVEKIMAKKEARMNSEPARKSRRAAGN